MVRVLGSLMNHHQCGEDCGQRVEVLIHPGSLRWHLWDRENGNA